MGDEQTGSVERRGETGPWWERLAHDQTTLLMTALCVGLIYFMLARLGLMLLNQPTGIAVFWPAAGFAAGALAALGPAARWPVAGSIATSNFLANLLTDAGPAASLVFAASNAVECVTFAVLLKRLDRRGGHLATTRSVVAFAAAAAAAPLVSGLVAAVGLEAIEPSRATLLQRWLTWYPSTMLGIVTVAPLLITLPALLREPPSPAMLIESILALALTLLLTHWAYRQGAAAPVWGLLAPITVVFPLFMWLGRRFPPAFSAAAAFMVPLVIQLAVAPTLARHAAAAPISDQVNALRVAILASSLCALALSAMFARLRSDARRLTDLVDELNHRVKNTLAVISAVVTASRGQSRSVDEYAGVLHGRIASMKQVHERLSQGSWAGVPVGVLVADEIAAYRTDDNVTLEGAEVLVPPSAARPLASTLHELATNAAKHGSLSESGGHLSVRWWRETGDARGEVLRLEWREHLKAAPPPAARDGYGARLIRNQLRHERGAEVDLRPTPTGWHCSITLPLEGGPPHR